MRGIHKVLLVAAAAGFALVLSGSLSATPTDADAQARLAANAVTYQDGTGESPGAPDIATVRVSNDDTRKLVFAVTFANRTSAGPTEWFELGVDTDRNAATGAQGMGFDYELVLYQGAGVLVRWDAASSNWAVVSRTRVPPSWVGPTLTFVTSADELGGTTGFRFGVYADANPEDDAAPWDGAGPWAYDIKLYTAPVLAIGKLDCLPEPGVAGKLLTGYTNVRVVRSGVPEKLGTAAKVTWQAKVGNVTLRPVAAKVVRNATGATALSSWKLPKTVKAKSVRVTVTVTMEGITVTKTHVHRIR
jgi:hypothetical protein